MREEIGSVDVAAFAEGKSFTLSNSSEPIRVTGTRVSAELFTILGVQPALGRWFRPGEDVVPHDGVVVLSHELWVRRFRSDSLIVGRFVRLDGAQREIVGVMPASFRFPSSRTDVWVPLALDSRNAQTYWAGDFMPMVGRLHAGTTLAQATGDFRLFQS